MKSKTVEPISVLAVTVANEVFRLFSPGSGLPQLLRRPFVGGGIGDGGMDNSASFRFHKVSNRKLALFHAYIVARLFRASSTSTGLQPRARNFLATSIDYWRRMAFSTSKSALLRDTSARAPKASVMVVGFTNPLI
jgi:hypothetical protein